MCDGVLSLVRCTGCGGEGKEFGTLGGDSGGFVMVCDVAVVL